jgi:uncharacterized protein YjiS (DUF1127 family)
MIDQATNPYLRQRATAAAERRIAIAGLLRRMRRGWEMLQRRRRARRDELFLLSQPDYILRDIGIGRGEIEFAVRGRGRR